jgi:hypothetical protein
MEKIIITQNKLLKLDTMPIENLLVTKLDAIYIEICECVLKEINKDSLSFISTISKTLKVCQTVEIFTRFCFNRVHIFQVLLFRN